MDKYFYNSNMNKKKTQTMTYLQEWCKKIVNDISYNAEDINLKLRRKIGVKKKELK